MSKQNSQFLSAALLVLFGLAILLFNFTTMTGLGGLTLAEVGDIVTSMGGDPSVWGVLVTILAWISIAGGLAFAFLAYKKNELVELVHLAAIGLGVVGLVFYILALDGSPIALAFYIQLISVLGISALKFVVK